MKKIAPLIFLLTVVFLAPLAHSAVLVGYWDFNESSGNTVYDQSGYDNDGQLTGATRTTNGKFGNALNFTGQGGVTVPHSASLDSLPGGFTMSAWIYPTNFHEYLTLFWKTDRYQINVIPHLHFQFGDHGSYPSGRLYTAFNYGTVNGGFEGYTDRLVALSEWHYVGLTFDETAVKFWLDGDEVYSTPWLGNTLDLKIGEHQELDYVHFYGLIDEPRIYRGALTRNEIIRDMNGGTVIPEPSALLLLSLGGLAAFFRQKHA